MDTNFGMKRRDFLGWAAAAGALALPG